MGRLSFMLSVRIVILVWFMVVIKFERYVIIFWYKVFGLNINEVWVVGVFCCGC